jgi:hypothetical protein
MRLTKRYSCESYEVAVSVEDDMDEFSEETLVGFENRLIDITNKLMEYQTSSINKDNED